MLGLDHVPIAVENLEAAADRYRALGFALKPGRPHGNGIRNVHAKFPDGTELELITAPEPRDALTITYRRHLPEGDGPAFLALFAPAVDDNARRLAPPYIFFGPRNHSPTDRPEHFAHPNGAKSLIRVWLAADDLSRERALLESVGRHEHARPCLAGGHARPLARAARGRGRREVARRRFAVRDAPVDLPDFFGPVVTGEWR